MGTLTESMDLAAGQAITLIMKETGETLSGDVETYCPKLNVVWINGHAFGERRLIGLGEVQYLRLNQTNASYTGGAGR